ncbi:MAG: hypothetical protein ACE1ZH_00390 [Gammaproteobacteria bacterium]
MQGHPQVLPEDIQQVLPSVISHRLTKVQDDGYTTQEDIAAYLIKQVPIP